MSSAMRPSGLSISSASIPSWYCRPEFSQRRTVTWDSQDRQLICSRRLTWSWMATATPAERTMAASTHSSSMSRDTSRASSALKKSRFQMLSHNAMPTLTTPSTTMLPVSIHATKRYPGAVQ